jgi:hypothetical protein
MLAISEAMKMVQSVVTALNMTVTSEAHKAKHSPTIPWCLCAHVNLLQQAAGAHCVSVFDRFAKIVRWNTYRAAMKRNGVWGRYDLNKELTADIISGIRTKYVCG